MAKKKDQDEMPDDKELALQLTIDSLIKKFGVGAIITGDADFPDIEYLHSGSLALDRALNGGYASGRIVEIIGSEAAGKTTLALTAIAHAQKAGYKCAFIDAEHSLDKNYSTRLGVNISQLLLAQPDCGEDALNTADMLIRSKAVKLIVIDSVSALTPRAEILGEVGDSHMGLQARMMGQALRKMTNICEETGTTVIFVNQIRMKIGVFFSSPETTSGGLGLKYFASQRLDIRRVTTLESGTEKIGIRAQVKVIKNKVGWPFKVAQFNIMFGKGIDYYMDVLEVALESGVVQKGGAWFSFEGKQLGHGAANATKVLKEDSEILNKILTLIEKERKSK